MLQELADAPDVPAEVVAKIGAIKQVEELREQLQVHFFPKLQVLGRAQVHVDERRSAEGVKANAATSFGYKQAIPQVPICKSGRAGSGRHRSERPSEVARIAVWHHDVVISAPAPNAQHIRPLDPVIGSGGGCLENGRNLEAPWHLIDTRKHEAVSLVVGYRTKVNGVKRVGRIGGPVAECRRIPLVSHTFRQYIAAVDAQVVRKASAERNVKAVVARTPDGFLVVDPAEDWQSGRRERCGEWASPCRYVNWIDVDGFRLM